MLGDLADIVYRVAPLHRNGETPPPLFEIFMSEILQLGWDSFLGVPIFWDSVHLEPNYVFLEF